ncbi:Rha family transcriptional regulator [Kineothrix sp. MB12-C1]|uniref:Rha family transcriptional regulator n=1 Tax=Kineothrix sp. MB12-C1 TaxID=3070215 RepID=UPI0027D3063C|nr:Rha family transcriptional regulator [Kineothrix sp. MB12-C1]WMC93221.1 Rha family transcriptional regulator [Kineothrix sp. MB12-C1]
MRESSGNYFRFRSPQNWGHLFKETEYVNNQNKQTYTEFLINRDGFSLLAMGFTGKNALEWKSD